MFCCWLCSWVEAPFAVEPSSTDFLLFCGGSNDLLPCSAVLFRGDLDLDLLRDPGESAMRLSFVCAGDDITSSATVSGISVNVSLAGS